MAELEELEQEDLDEQLLDVEGPATDNLPSVPTAEPVVPARGLSKFQTVIIVPTPHKHPAHCMPSSVPFWVFYI